MYSQNNEDDRILEIVKARGLTTGKFLDIGASNGELFSNTRALVELGWMGVLVEPSIIAFSHLLRKYGGNPQIRLVHAAIGKGWSLSLFWDQPSVEGFATTEPSNRIKWSERGQKFLPDYYIPEIPLSWIFLMFGPSWDVVSIDTEGTSVDIFRTWPLATFRPLVFIVEHDGQIESCLDHAEIHGYELLERNAENLILVRTT